MRHLILLLISLFFIIPLAGFGQDTTWNAKFILIYGPYTDTVYFGCSTAASDGLDSFDLIDTNYSYRSQPIGIRSGITELNSQYGCANLKRNYKSFENSDKFGQVTFDFYAYVHQDVQNHTDKLNLSFDTLDFIFLMPPYKSRGAKIIAYNGYVGAMDSEDWIIYNINRSESKFSNYP